MTNVQRKKNARKKTPKQLNHIEHVRKSKPITPLPTQYITWQAKPRQLLQLKKNCQKILFTKHLNRPAVIVHRLSMYKLAVNNNRLTDAPTAQTSPPDRDNPRTDHWIPAGMERTAQKNTWWLVHAPIWSSCTYLAIEQLARITRGKKGLQVRSFPRWIRLLVHQAPT